jgi:hypothetical protein
VNVLAVDRDAFQALFSTPPPLRMFFERLIEDRMAPMTTHHAEGEELADDRPAVPASGRLATRLFSGRRRPCGRWAGALRSAP